MEQLAALAEEREYTAKVQELLLAVIEQSDIIIKWFIWQLMCDIIRRMCLQIM